MNISFPKIELSKIWVKVNKETRLQYCNEGKMNGELSVISENEKIYRFSETEKIFEAGMDVGIAYVVITN